MSTHDTKNVSWEPRRCTPPRTKRVVSTPGCTHDTKDVSWRPGCAPTAHKPPGWALSAYAARCRGHSGGVGAGAATAHKTRGWALSSYAARCRGHSDVVAAGEPTTPRRFTPFALASVVH